MVKNVVKWWDSIPHPCGEIVLFYTKTFHKSLDFEFLFFSIHIKVYIFAFDETA